MMDKLEEDLQLALAEKYDERAHDSQLLEQLRAEKARETSKLQEVVTVRETVVAENERFQKELCQLQQQVESTNTAMQDQVSWNDVQLFLHQTHGELVSATTRFWNTIEAFQNRRLAFFCLDPE
jgi:ABC-type phosphate transport system auxiliary subunit